MNLNKKKIIENKKKKKQIFDTILTKYSHNFSFQIELYHFFNIFIFLYIAMSALNNDISEIREFLNSEGFDIIESIGKGGFAECFKVYSQQYKEYFACKVFDLPEHKKELRSKSFQNEFNALSNILHPNIIHVYKHFITPTKIYLILEYCPNQDLFKHIRKNGPLTNISEIFSCFTMILTALDFLEENHLSHNDIKPSNILIDKYGRLKLADFGLVKFLSETHQLSDNYSGSLAFLAPEVLEHKPFDPIKADVWSFGVTAFVIATGNFPFQMTSKTSLKLSILAGIYKIPDTVDIRVAEIIRKCLNLNPSQRPTFKELILLIQNITANTLKSRSLRVPRQGQIQKPDIIKKVRSHTLKTAKPMLSRQIVSLNRLSGGV